jgi:AraC-like DNA-binding protein
MNQHTDLSSADTPIPGPLTSLTSPPPPAGNGGPEGEEYQKLETPERLLERAAEPAILRIQEDYERASERLRPLLKYLEIHLFDPELNVNQLKIACGIRDNSIVIRFHSEVGHTPRAYISGLRLETAARLLRDTGLRLWQISELLGYSGLGVFSKAFQRWAGLRPRFYREEIRQRDEKNRPAPVEVFDNRLLERALQGRLESTEAHRLIHRLCDLYEVDRGELGGGSEPV